jgi:hypothetical protein
VSNFAFVQATACTPNTTSQAFTSHNTAGNILIVIAWYGGDAPTDTQGNTYTLVQAGWSWAETAIYAAFNCAAGANTVTSVGCMAVIAMEYSSAAATCYICPGHVAAGPGDDNQIITSIDSGNGPSGGGSNFTSADEVMVIFAGFSTDADGTWTIPAGTIRWHGPTNGGFEEAPYASCVGDNDVANIATSYTNSPFYLSGAGVPQTMCIFLNLTGVTCTGGTSGAPGGGESGSGAGDSSYGSTGSSLVPTPNPGMLAVYFESEERWMYHRNAVGMSRFYGFLFDGVMMIGLTGSTPVDATSNAVAYNVDDFRGFLQQDEPLTGSTGVAIECVYQSHFEDVNYPDNEKMWLEIVVDYLLGNTNTANVLVGYNNFAPATVGTLTATAGLRKQVSFLLGTDGVLAKNISVQLDTFLNAPCEIHNVYLFYYLEARRALAASTIPIDLGSPLVKQCKELMLDIDASDGAVNINIYSDLPGNTLAVRQTPSAVTTSGRAIIKFPFSVTEGFLWRVALTAATSGTFRLYGARLLMRPIGVYVEAYESAAGFIYDSEPHSFESLLTKIPRAYAIALSATPIKRFREISLEIETFNENVTVSFLTDLPGNTEVVRSTFTVNTALLGRRYVRLPLPLAIGTAAWVVGTTYALNAFCSYAGNSWQSLAGTNLGNTPSTTSTWWQPLPIEGRICRLQISGTSKYVLYDAAVELLPVGLYIEAYEAAGGAVYDSREMDFGSQKPKEARELELDIETTGAVTATLYCDLPGYTMVACYTNTGISTTGRQKVLLPLTLDAAPYDYPIGRFYRLVITGTNAFRLYDAQIKLREFGCYLVGDEASASPIGVFDTTPMDCGTERLKEFKKIELEIQTDSTGTATLNLWTDQPAGSLTLQFTTTINTGATRQSVKIPMTSGIRGRLVQVEVTGCGVRLFNGRIWTRAFNDPKSQWTWIPMPIPPTPGEWAWAKFPVNPTPPANDLSQWIWGKFMSVTETPDTWTFVDVPFEVTG